MKKHQLMIQLATPALLAILALTAAVRAAVPVTNAGFEIPVLADGLYSSPPAIPGWSAVDGGDINVWNPGTGDFPAQAPEGANVAWVYAATSVQGLGQVLSGPTGLLQLDAGYSLTVKVGNSATFTGFPGYRVQLLAGGTVLAQDDDTLAPGEGSFVTATVNYTYNPTHSALVGQPLEIRLLSKGLASDTEVEFDDVQLSATYAHPVAAPGGPYAVPSVGSLALNGSGSLPSDGATITSYEWDLNNDGTFGDVTGATPAAISYATLTATWGMILGPNTIKLRVADSTAQTATTATTVTLTLIANAGFEDLLTIGDGTDGDYDYATDPPGGEYYVWPLPNWGYYGQDYSGMYNPLSGDFTAGVPEGQCVGFVEADTRANPGPVTGGLRQVLGADLAPNTAYTLQVKVGNPLKVDYSFNTFPGYRVQLWAGTTLLAEDPNTLPVPQGGWVTSTVVYSSGASVTPAQKLEIRLVNMGISPGGSGQDHYVMYDDVSLATDAVVPTNANLALLAPSVGTLTPDFDDGTLSYTASAPYAASSMTVKPTAQNPAATIKVNDVAVTSGTPSGPISLSVGPNVITTVVTAPDGVTTKTYTLTVTRAAASTNANLANLVTTPDTPLNPTFDPGTTSYTASEPYATSSMTVTPTKADPGATITVNGNPVASGAASAPISLSVGPNIITIVVTAEDTSTKSYTLTVTREAPSNNANLADLVPSAGTLTPAFASGTITYTATVPYPVTTITVTPTAADTLATITVNGNAVASGSESAPIPLSVGANIISTVVTAEDASTKTYTLTVTREPDTTPPTIASLSPPDDTAAASTSNFAVTFDEPIAIGTGNITIRNTDPVPDPDVVIDITSGSPQVSVSGAVLTINPTADLVVGKSYAIQIAAGAIKDLSNNPFAGIVNDTTWNFTASLPSYTWIQTAGGAQDWTTPGNWSPAGVPNPATGATVDFSTVNIAANTTLTLGADRTAEVWKFGDTSGAQTWTVNTGNQMILAGTTPTIQVNQNTLTLSNVVAGTQGLTKTGAGALTLSGANTYSGGTFINGGGTVTISADASLGATGGAVTVNNSFTLLSGTNLTLNRAFALGTGTILSWDVGGNNSDGTISGAVTGSGGIKVTETLGLKLPSTGNTFTGPITMGGGIYAGRLYVNSIGDAPGAGTIQVGSATGYGAGTFQWDAGATTPLTLNYRQIDVASPGGSANIVNNNANAANIVTVNTDLLSTTATAGTKTLVLSGSNAGDNLIAGKIVNGATGAVALSKQGAGTWIVSGANTYTGGTTVAAGTLKANGAGTLGTGNVTVTGTTTLLVIGTTNVMADTAALRLPSATTKNLTMNGDQAVAALYLGGVQQPNGVYSAATNASDWMNGSGTLTVGPAAAQPVYWDLDGATAGAGGATPAGTWDAASTSWTAAADGTGTAAAWTAGRTATFAAGADATGIYTVTVDGTQDIGGLTFDEGTVTLSGGTALRMVSDSLAYVAPSLTATVQTPISQDATTRGLAKSGTGTLVLAGANSFTGPTTISAGTLQLTHADAISSSSGLVVQGGNAIIDTSVGLKTLFFDTTVARTVTGAGTLSFAPGGIIRNLDNRIDCTISTAITGAPAVNIKDLGAGNTYLGLKFAPTSGTQTLGAVLNPDNTGTSDKAGITLAGSTTGNSVASISYAGGDRYSDTNFQSGEWTVLGDTTTGTVKVTGGTHTLNGTVGCYYNEMRVTGGTVKGAFTIFTNDKRGAPYVTGTGTIAPGASIGTVTLDWGTTGTPAAGIDDYAFSLRTGATYEWEVGAGNTTDKIHLVEGRLFLQNFTLKILAAGGSPVATDQLPVFTYAAGVTRDLTGFPNLPANFVLPAGWSGTPSLVDNGTGTIYLTGVSATAAAAYDDWATAKGLDGSPGKEKGKGDDPDKDGKSNLYEFGVDGDPLSAVNDGKIVGKIATVGGSQVLTLTLPVRTGATFSANSGDLLSALIDGIHYRIEGSVNLATFDKNIAEAIPAITDGLPSPLTTGWTYRTFTFAAPDTVPTVSKAFLRAKVSETP